MTKRSVGCMVGLALIAACEIAPDTPAAMPGSDNESHGQGDRLFSIAHDAGADAAANAQDSFAANAHTLISPEAMPVSENGVYTDDGRFFVVGNDTLYEVVSTGQDQFAADVLLKEDCYLGGMTDRENFLYIPCVSIQSGDTGAELLRVDPSDPHELRIDRAPFPPGADILLLNGMDFGPDGSLYLSNSDSLLSGDPAVYRVVITSDDPFAIEVEPFLEADFMAQLVGDGAGQAPNGIRIEGDDLYLSRGFSLIRIPLIAGGGHGPLSVVYESANVIDDFCIIEGQLLIAELNLLGFFSNNLVPSQVTDVTTDGVLRGTVDVGFLPSSTSARRDTLFGASAVIVTSYFNGGLYRIDARPEDFAIGVPGWLASFPP